MATLPTSCSSAAWAIVVDLFLGSRAEFLERRRRARLSDFLAVVVKVGTALVERGQERLTHTAGLHGHATRALYLLVHALVNEIHQQPGPSVICLIVSRRTRSPPRQH